MSSSAAPPDPPSSPPSNPDTPDLARRRLHLARVAESLRSLHKQLMNEARAEFERERGPVPSAAMFLNLLMGDPFFAWLRPLSGAMAELDELLDAPAPGPDHARLVRVRFEALVTEDGEGDFPTRYRDYLQRSADVVVAHAMVRLALRPL